MDRQEIINWQADRERQHEIVMDQAGIIAKRFHNLDWQVYQEGVLPAKTKELMGFVSSLVLRCDDCILYHLLQLRQSGITREELEEAVSIGLIIGGSITIPHVRRVWETWANLESEDDAITD